MKNNHSLTDSLQLAPSELFVADLQLMTNYYRDIVGLSVLSSTKTSTILGYGQIPVITLISRPKLAHASPRSAGLFHNAIVFGSRGDLAQTVGNTIMHAPERFVGTGDHLVSEAFYFNDPEQNGLELYFDRPRDTWQWQNGQIVMDTLYIDPMDYINTHASDAGATDIKLGHVHLKVGDITKARLFYVDMLGFDITAMMPGALFVSIAGYHHHLGLNTWQSGGAGMRTPTLGLSDVTINLAHDADVARLAVRLEQASYPFAYTNGIVHVSDPWGNSLILNSLA
jgi:catechol 2,3-dioxygenase